MYSFVEFRIEPWKLSKLSKCYRVAISQLQDSAPINPCCSGVDSSSYTILLKKKNK